MGRGMRDMHGHGHGPEEEVFAEPAVADPGRNTRDKHGHSQEEEAFEEPACCRLSSMDQRAHRLAKSDAVFGEVGGADGPNYTARPRSGRRDFVEPAVAVGGLADGPNSCSVSEGQEM